MSSARPIRKRLWLTLILWSGLLLCVVAAARFWDESKDLLQSVGVAGFMGLLLIFVPIWLAALTVWRQVMVAFGAAPMPLRDAARHLALLLLGKYLPGGIWGFAARMADSSRHYPAAGMLAAGLSEQLLAVASMAMLAFVALLAAFEGQAMWLFGVVLVPAFAMSALAVLLLALRGMREFLERRLPKLVHMPYPPIHSAMWTAAVAALLQQAAILLLAGAMAWIAFELPAAAALGAAGAYGLGVVAGVLAVVVPGGILVREAVFVAASAEWLATEQAVVLAAGLRLVFTGFDLLAGIVGLWLQWGRRAHG